jgi:pimeloyl-ACP methyl ester carboxylesterase
MIRLTFLLLAAAVATAAGAQEAPAPTAPAPVVPPDAAREQAIADRLAGRMAAEEVVWLEGGGSKSLALYAEQTAPAPKGAAIIVHGMAGNADSEPLIRLLRTELPASGWSTLSVQLPVLPAGTPRASYAGSFEASGQRIAAAIAHLKGRQQLNIVLVGHELGAAAAIRAAAAAGGELRALVLLGLSSVDDLTPPAETAAAYEKIEVPVLDLDAALLAGDNAAASARRMNEARKAGLAAYSQTTLVGTDSGFTGMAEVLLARLRGWLDKAAPGMSLPAAGAPAPVQP